MASTYTRLNYHLVFSTKERRQLILPRFQQDLYDYIGGIIKGEGGVLLEAGGISDHVHLLAHIPARLTLATAMQHLKGNSSKWLNASGKSEVRFEWQAGYSAFTVSESQVERVRDYIRSQEEHHKSRDFQMELLALLKSHRVDFDERYLWD